MFLIILYVTYVSILACLVLDASGRGTGPSADGSILLERYFLLDEHLLKGIRGPVGKDGCIRE